MIERLSIYGADVPLPANDLFTERYHAMLLLVDETDGPWQGDNAHVRGVLHFRAPKDAPQPMLRAFFNTHHTGWPYVTGYVGGRADDIKHLWEQACTTAAQVTIPFHESDGMNCRSSIAIVLRSMGLSFNPTRADNPAFRYGADHPIVEHFTFG